MNIKLISCFFYLTISYCLVFTTFAQRQLVQFKRVIVNEENDSFTLEKPKETLKNKVLVAIIIKDNAYSLPTFLATLETLKCPTKNKKCDLW